MTNLLSHIGAPAFIQTARGIQFSVHAGSSAFFQFVTNVSKVPLSWKYEESWYGVFYYEQPEFKIGWCQEVVNPRTFRRVNAQINQYIHTSTQNLELLKKTALTEQQRKFLKEIEKSSYALMGDIQNLLDCVGFYFHLHKTRRIKFNLRSSMNQIDVPYTIKTLVHEQFIGDEFRFRQLLSIVTQMYLLKHITIDYRDHQLLLQLHGERLEVGCIKRMMFNQLLMIFKGTYFLDSDLVLLTLEESHEFHSPALKTILIVEQSAQRFDMLHFFSQKKISCVAVEDEAKARKLLDSRVYDIETVICNKPFEYKQPLTFFPVEWRVVNALVYHDTELTVIIIDNNPFHRAVFRSAVYNYFENSARTLHIDYIDEADVAERREIRADIIFEGVEVRENIRELTWNAFIVKEGPGEPQADRYDQHLPVPITSDYDAIYKVLDVFMRVKM